MYELTGIPSTDLLASRLAATQQTTISRLQPLLPRLPGTAVFSHTTAYRILGIPLPERYDLRDNTIHVSTPDPRHRRHRITGVSWHIWPLLSEPDSFVDIYNVPCISPAHALAQMSMHTEFGQLVVSGDTLLCRNSNLRRAEMTDFRQLLHSRFKGSCRFSRMLPLLREGTDSPKETELRLHAMRFGLPCPEVNFPVNTRGHVNHADMGYPDFKVILEYDGLHHFTSREQWERDWEKRNRWIAAGWSVFVATAATLASEDALIRYFRDVERALHANGAEMYVTEPPMSVWELSDRRRHRN